MAEEQPVESIFIQGGKMFKIPKGKKFATVDIALSKEEVESCKDMKQVLKKLKERFEMCAVPSFEDLVENCEVRK